MQAKCFANEEQMHVPLNECTPFVLHVRHRLPQGTDASKFEDLIEHKLRLLIKSTNDLQKHMILCVMLQDYIKAGIACAFWKGVPVYVSITNDR
jgi:hypothetical protein